MPKTEVLVLAMTKMLSGICTAGVTREPDPVTGLRWVRPVREFGSLLPGDMTYEDGHLVACCDVVELNLLSPHSDPPHAEDWLTDFVHQRPQLLRRLQGKKRERFFADHLDRAPEDVLVHHRRSLCLVKPEKVCADFALDPYSRKYQARMSFVLSGQDYAPQATNSRGISVTDLKWRALGRAWLGEASGHLRLEHETLHERLQAEVIYLSLGLSRSWQGAHWLLVIGVHAIPDCEATIDLHCL